LCGRAGFLKCLAECQQRRQICAGNPEAAVDLAPEQAPVLLSERATFSRAEIAFGQSCPPIVFERFLIDT
jgi:hypothetical protein